MGMFHSGATFCGSAMCPGVMLISRIRGEMNKDPAYKGSPAGGLCLISEGLQSRHAHAKGTITRVGFI